MKGAKATNVVKNRINIIIGTYHYASTRSSLESQPSTEDEKYVDANDIEGIVTTAVF